MGNYNKVDIRVVKNEEERMQAMIVRSLVYMGEQACPYAEEFDLNDHAATQIIGLIGSEPVLTARIRYFGGVAKLERLAVRKAYRGKGYGQQLLDFLMEFCQAKGFSKVYLHAQQGKEGFYLKNGFTAMNTSFSFSGYAYTEMACELAQSDLVLDLESGPMMINRPEGDWYTAGPLEGSTKAKAKAQLRLVSH
jgi:predicted GNAT family N-acyltransferase